MVATKGTRHSSRMRIWTLSPRVKVDSNFYPDRGSKAVLLSLTGGRPRTG